MDKKKALMEMIIQDLIAYIVEDQQIEIEMAMDQLYNSMIFEKLINYETGLYLEGSAYIYNLFLNEKENGRLIQEEI